MLKSVSTILVAALATTAAHAQAGTGQGPVQSEAVFYGDLDLTSARGVAALDRRIKSAARRVCRVHYHPASLIERSEMLTCLKTTAAVAAPQRDAAIATARRGERGVQLALVIK